MQPCIATLLDDRSVNDLQCFDHRLEAVFTTERSVVQKHGQHAAVVANKFVMSALFMNRQSPRSQWIPAFRTTSSGLSGFVRGHCGGPGQPERREVAGMPKTKPWKMRDTGLGLQQPLELGTEDLRAALPGFALYLLPAKVLLPRRSYTPDALVRRAGHPLVHAGRTFHQPDRPQCIGEGPRRTRLPRFVRAAFAKLSRPFARCSSRRSRTRSPSRSRGAMKSAGPW